MIRRLFEKLKLIKPRQPNLPQTNVMRSCYTEVWQKWCELEYAEFDTWLYKKMHDAYLPALPDEFLLALLELDFGTRKNKRRRVRK